MEGKETMGVMPEATQSAHAEAEVKETVSFAPKPEYREYGEDRSERREGRRVIRMEGGRAKLVLSSEAEEYRDTDGNWQDTDNTLEYRAAEDDDFAGYETKGNRYRVRLPENAKNAILMRVQEGESRLDIRLKERCRTAKGALASRKGKVVNYERGIGGKSRKCGEIGYRNIFEKTDVRYNLEGGKIKESIVVKERRESYRYEFCIETEQAELVREETGGILIRRGEEQLFRIPEAFMEDANGEVSNAVAYELEEESAGHYHFAIAADAEWLNAEERAFPVLIDPTLIKETGVTLRCVGRTTKTKYDSSGCPCGTETVYATNSAIKVGKSGNTVYRSYVNFDLGDISLHNISTATLRLTLKATGSGTYYVARATQKSESSNTFVAKTPTRDILTFDTVKDENDSNVYLATADITLSVREWQDGNSNYGIVVYGNEMANSSLEIESAALTFVCQDPYAKSSSSFQKNDVRRAGSSAVDLYAGRLLFEHKNFEFMSENMPMNVSHVYNSDYSSEEINGSMKLGSGWRLNFQQFIEVMDFSGYDPESGNASFVYTDGCGVQHEAVHRYYETKSGDTQYDSSGRKYKQYIEEPTSASAFDYTTKEGLRFEPSNMYLYDNSGGNIYFDKIDDSTMRLKGFYRNGKNLEATYGSGNRIASVTDGAGKIAYFTYNNIGYLQSITCEGNTVSYEYNDDKLMKINYPDGTRTEFRYSGSRLARVIDRSGYQLIYSYSSEGKVISVREEVENATIGSTVTAAQCPISGDCWDIKYLRPLQTQVINRNGLVVEYIFDHEGNTVTVSEAEHSVSDYDKQALCGMAAYRKEIKSKGDSSDSYVTKKQVIEATLHHQTNLLSPIETWTKYGTTSIDGPSTVCYVEGGKSMKLTGALKSVKSVRYTVTNKISESGVYVFGCWAKAENSLASVDREYVGSDSRYFGILLTVYHKTGGKSYYYASFDPHNTGWQQAAIVVDVEKERLERCYLEAIYSYNQGDVYFDHAFGALTDGAVADTYDNNYSETRYHGYTVTTLYDIVMHVVKSCVQRKGDANYYATTYNYSTANRLDSTVDPNGIETVNDVNEENANILEKTIRKGDIKLRETSEYDNGDYLIRSVNTNGSETTFDYNTDGSLKSATLPSGQTISYAYNNMGQLLSLTANVDGKSNANSITYKYGYVTRLQHVSTTYDFTYDGYGRVRTVKAGGMTVLTNTYTDFGTNLDGVSGAVSRVVSKDAMGNTVTAYADKYGRVIASKKNNEEPTKEVYDLAGNLTQHIDNELGISYNYEYNGQKYFYRKNLQGDIIGIYDSCWNLLGLYEYDAWGNLLSQVGSEILKINPFRYRGYYYDAETGLYYLNSRYYDPEIGRFISPDSLAYLEPETCNGLNLYAYCRNNPVMYTDPYGFFAVSTFIVGLLAAVGALTIAGAAIGGLSAAIHQENVFTGIRNGAITGLMFGISIALVATGIGAGGFVGTIMVGMGVGSAYLLGSNLNLQLQRKGFGRIEIGAGAHAWVKGVCIGGLVAGFSYLFSSVLSIYGEMFGAALAGKTFLGVQISKIISIGTSIELGGLIGGAIGGSLAGKIFNNAAVDSGLITSAIPLWLINLLKKIFK